MAQRLYESSVAVGFFTAKVMIDVKGGYEERAGRPVGKGDQQSCRIDAARNRHEHMTWTQIVFAQESFKDGGQAHPLRIPLREGDVPSPERCHPERLSAERGV
ncbi:MAG TPA: hypothetical protein VHL58_00595 [Thermoanaerobaculia bacterium]|nr:hypothetical protein [Thermoanaerobaculia bacterium]